MGAMFKKILVPVDLSDRHQPALTMAARLVTPDAGEVILLHVIEVPLGLARDEEPTFYHRLERKAGLHLNRFTDLLKGRNVLARPVILFGERAPEILRFAEREAVDLLLLASHPVDPVNPAAGWGTLSYLLGIAARCPVLLVK
jgi:nucleotide-binding universal stress UspA family protein